MEQKGTDIKGQTIVFDLPDDKDKNVNIPEQSSSSSSKTSASENKVIKKPTCIIILGMAGSGKTTFVQRLASHLHIKAKSSNKVPYVINLDPACMEVSINELGKIPEGLKEHLYCMKTICETFYSFSTRFHIQRILIFEIQLITKKL